MAETMQLQKGADQTVTELQERTFGTIFNHTMRHRTDMHLMDSISWSGSFTFLPNLIPYDGSHQFIHQSDGHGSKGAVEYTIVGANNEECAFVLAWDAPANHNPAKYPNKVYIECNTREYIESLTWETILRKLDNGNTTVEAIDENAHIRANGDINRMNPHPAATLNAHFRHTI